MIDLEKVAEVVREAGYIAAVEDERISFKVEGITYRFETFEGDDKYMRVRVSFLIPAGVSVETLLGAANEQNRKTKAVKTVVYLPPEDNRVGFSVELFFDDLAIWSAVFERALAAIRMASDEFYGSLAELASV